MYLRHSTADIEYSPDIIPTKIIEKIGRVCYKSEDKITEDSSIKFVKNIIDRGHESVLEHCNISVKFIVSRGISHELVRHRLCAISQESTRYVNYNKQGLEFIIPSWLELVEGNYTSKYLEYYGVHAIPTFIWLKSLLAVEEAYNQMIDAKCQPQQARDVLPNALKTELVMTANVREWRHILKLRTSKAAHPDMQAVMNPLLTQFKAIIPVVFDDIEVSHAN